MPKPDETQSTFVSVTY